MSSGSATAPVLDVSDVAKLARLHLSDEETHLFQEQLRHVLEFADKLNQLDLTDVEPAAHAIPLFNVFREDAQHDGLSATEALSNSPQQANGLFLVTKVLE